MVINKLLFLSYMPTTIYFSYFHTNIIAMLYLVHSGFADHKSSYLYTKFTCTNKNGNFVKETDTSGYIVV